MCPSLKDTVWLDCTSTLAPAGFLSSLTENRHALLITPNGGYLIKTPSSNFLKNNTTSKIELTLQTNRSADATINFIVKNDPAFFNYEVLVYGTAAQKEDLIKEFYNLSNYNLSGQLSNSWSADSVLLKISIPANFPSCFQLNGKRIFINPCVKKEFSNPISNSAKRINPVVNAYPYSSNDTIIIKNVPGYRIEYIPDNMSIKKTFGEFSANYATLPAGDIKCVYSFSVYNKTIPAKDYDEYADFVNKIIKEQSRKLVLVSTTP